MNILKRIYKDPLWVGSVVLRHFLSPHIKDDATFIKWEYFFGMHKWPNLKCPRSFNEKLQWLKLHDRNHLYTKMVDKAESKDYVNSVLGTDAYCIPTLGLWNSFDEIDFDKLPDQFVLKTTHDSGGIVICKDKSKLDINAAKNKLEKSLKHNYYLEHREWPYKGVKPRILAEEYLSTLSDEDIEDYKIHCFNGEPKFILVCSERFSETGLKEDFLDINWNLLPFKRPNHPRASVTPQKPAMLNEMLELARKLSKGFPFLRVDLYCSGDRIYFGELTFFPSSGNVPFDPAEWDIKIGEMLSLPSQPQHN